MQKLGCSTSYKLRCASEPGQCGPPQKHQAAPCDTAQRHPGISGISGVLHHNFLDRCVQPLLLFEATQACA